LATAEWSPWSVLVYSLPILGGIGPPVLAVLAARILCVRSDRFPAALIGATLGWVTLVGVVVFAWFPALARLTTTGALAVLFLPPIATSILPAIGFLMKRRREHRKRVEDILV